MGREEADLEDESKKGSGYGGKQFCFKEAFAFSSGDGAREGEGSREEEEKMGGKCWGEWGGRSLKASSVM